LSTISIIIPNHNREGLIGETLECLLRQTRPAEEVIVVDDGSTDGSVAVIRGFGDRVRLIEQANAGPGAARNTGLAAARGEFVQFFDSDDLCSLNKLEVQARALETSGADIAYGPWLQAWLADGEAVHPELALQQHPLPPARSALAWFLRGWVIVFQCCLIRRSLIERAGPYREDFAVGEDLELLFRMLRLSPRLVHTPEALVLYRLHEGQISRGETARRRQSENLVRLADSLLARLVEDPAGIGPGDLGHWRFVAWQQARLLSAIDPSVAPPAPPGAWLRLDHARRAVWQRLRSGLARRLLHTSQPACFGPGALHPGQVALIEALGYRPRLSSKPPILSR
jgi:glycosyltransferase involved in cell wall biosynthesis